MSYNSPPTTVGLTLSSDTVAVGVPDTGAYLVVDGEVRVLTSEPAEAGWDWFAMRTRVGE